MKVPILLLVFLCAAFAPAAAVEYPLTVSADGRNLLDDHGDPVLFNADTPWHLAARLTRSETIEYLDDRANLGINAMLMALMPTDAYNTYSTENAYGEEPFLVPDDFSQPNDAYFQHVDWVIEQAHLRGITMFITPVYMGYDCNPEGWCAAANAAGPAVMRDFGRWVGNRYRDQPNIVWVQGGDVDVTPFGALPEVEALVEGIKEVDPDHLHTAHCNRQNSGRDCYDLPWLDFDTTYSDCSRTPAEVKEDYQRVPWMPSVYIEGIYEYEHDVSDECIRAQAWWSALGGMVGHFFGSGRVWDFPYYWRDGLDSAGGESMKHFGIILEARGWGQLVPDYAQNVMVSGYGDINSANYAATALRSDRNSALAYIPTPRTVTIAMDRIEGTESDVWWIEPGSGAGTYVGRFTTTGHRDFTTPGPGDWVLVVDNASANLSDPWVGSTAVGATSGTSRVQLHSATPNPFNPRTVLSFSGPAGSHLLVSIYDTRGRLIGHVFDGPATGGLQSMTWEPRELASGTYFVRVTGDGETSVRKVALLK